MRQRIQLKKFAIPTLFDEVLTKRRKSRKKKKNKSLNNEEDSTTFGQEIKTSCANPNSGEIRLIFSEKCQVETNERFQSEVKPTKKRGRKRKTKNSEAQNLEPPRGKEALEEFRQKYGIFEHPEEVIAAHQLLTQISIEHSYFVHESAKLLKIKLTLAQEEVIEVKEKLDRCRLQLMLEKRKRARIQERCKRLLASSSLLKQECQKQKQLLSKFNFLAGVTKDSLNSTSQSLKDVKPDHILEEDPSQQTEPHAHATEELETALNNDEFSQERLGTNLTPSSKFRRKDSLPSLNDFSATLRRISPEAYDFVRSSMSKGLPEIQALTSKPSRARKKRKKPVENQLESQIHSGNYQFQDELTEYQLVETISEDLISDMQVIQESEVGVQQFEPIEIISQPFIDPDPNNCVYFKFDPNLCNFDSQNQFPEFFISIPTEKCLDTD